LDCSAATRKHVSSGYDAGRTERRHVVVAAVRLIGKEANRLDDDMPANMVGEDVTEFGDEDEGSVHESPVQRTRPI
jgi:hypothetical protein